MSLDRRERLDELFLDRALGVLDIGAEAELETLLAALPEAERQRLAELDDPEAWELAAAAVHLAAYSAEPAEDLPAGLEERLVGQARAFFADRERVSEIAGPVAGDELTGVAAPAAGAPVIELKPRPAARRGGSLLGWYAAAAALLMAVLGWWTALSPRPGDTTPPAVEITQARPTLEQVRAAADAVVVPWQGTGDPAAAGTEGEVVWSDSLQTGFMVFRGLEANDPTAEQYQLWIFDAAQDERYPVDGGVFDVAGAEGEVVVPIDPKLHVADPTLFAVTVEKPGGVVVSSRERLVLIAQPV